MLFNETMDDHEVNNALDTLGYLIHILPSLIYYAPDEVREYETAFETVYDYIRTYQKKVEDDLK